MNRGEQFRGWLVDGASWAKFAFFDRLPKVTAQLLRVRRWGH